MVATLAERMTPVLRRLVKSGTPDTANHGDTMTQQGRYTVIESKVWVHTPTGRRVSIYGASPWTSQADRPNWQIMSQGWTFRDNVFGSIGLGRKPFATKAEAEHFLTTIY